MRISVAMCTYNGELFLQEQLDSIAAQTRLPDELVICDDASQDRTIEIAQTFAAQAPFPVQVVVNEQNLGSTKNFEKAIQCCQGEIIALSDQDDVWASEKLKKIETAFTEDEAIGLVFSDGDIVDRKLCPLGLRLSDTTCLTKHQKSLFRQGQFFQVLLDHNIVTGATMAVRSSYREMYLPIPDSIPLIHDGWIALTVSSVAKTYFIPDPLILYRQHPQQQLGAVLHKNSLARKVQVLPESHYRGHLAQLQHLSERLSLQCEKTSNKTSANSAKRLIFCRLHIQHIETRLALPPNRFHRLTYVLQELLTGRYHRYSNGWYSAVRDLL